MEELQAMFPNIPLDNLRLIYQHCNGDVESAVECILSQMQPELAFESQSVQQEVVEEQLELLTPKSLIRHGLSQHINNPQLSDVVLVCDGGEVYAHQCILMARSEYFRALLASVEDPSEGRKRLEMEGMPEDICLLLLQYLYTDRINLPDEKAHELHRVATNLGLLRLQYLCEGVKPPDSTYASDTYKMLCEPEEYKSDVKLLIEGETIRCHKLLLSSASAYFKALLTGPMAESKQSVISLEDTQANLFKVILEAIYRDGSVTRGTITPQNAVGLVLAASRFLVPAVQQRAEEVIANNLDVENVCEVLEVMWHVSSSLKHLCLQYIFQNFDLVQNTEAFAALPEVMKLEIIQRFDKDNEESLLSLVRAVSSQDINDLGGSIKMEVFSFLHSQLEEMTLDDQSGTADTPIGEVNWGIKNLNILANQNGANESASPVALSPDDIEVSFGRKQLTIKVQNLRFEMPEVKWNYVKLQFPKLEDDGTATICAANICIELTFEIISSGLGIPTLQVKHFSTTVGSLDVKFANSKADWIYNMFAKIFSSKIKASIESEMTKLLSSSVTELTVHINHLSTKLLQ